MARQLEVFADRDAYKALAHAIILELMNPEMPRRYSLPDAHTERAQLLDHVNRQSWDARNARAKASHDEVITPQVIALSVPMVETKRATYAKEAKEMGVIPVSETLRPPPRRNKPRA